MAHKEAQSTFDRHFPIWRKLADQDGHGDVLVAYPSNSRVMLPEKGNCQAVDCGKAEHTGLQSIVRIRTVFERMNFPGYDRYAFFEYDAIAFRWPTPGLNIAAPVFRDDSPTRGFIGTMFTHPPLFFSPVGLNTLVKEIQQMPMDAEKAVWDRWIGLAIQRTGMEPFDLLSSGQAYAENTIPIEHYTRLARAVRHGAYAFHGVKTQECLDVILENNRIREAVELVRAAGAKVEWQD
jgi:hypothetical protein